MNLPKINENTEDMIDDISISIFIHYISLVIIISFLLICIFFSYEIGKNIGYTLGNEITSINNENKAKVVERKLINY